MPGAGSALSSFSLQQYRKRLGARLGWHLYTNVTTLSTSSDILICSDLQDVDLDAGHTSGVWAWNSTAAQQRRVKANTLIPTTGQVTLTRGYSAIAASTAAIEFYGVLPPQRALGLEGLHSCINYALAECWSVDSLSIAGVADQTAYSLVTEAPWIDTDEWVVDVYYRPSGGTVDSLIREWRFLPNADAPTIELRSEIGTADTLKPRVYRPMDRWIKVGGTWATSTTGLVNETDEALLSLEGMEAVALVHAYEALATLGSESEQERWTQRARGQRLRAEAWKRDNLRRETGRPRHWFDAARTDPYPNIGTLG